LACEGSIAACCWFRGHNLIGFARRSGAALGLSDASIEAVVETITRAQGITGHRQSLRDAIRMLERAEVLQSRPWLN